jgi:cytochrome P450
MPPGPIPLPLIGNLHQSGVDIPYSLEKIREKYGELYTVTFPIGHVVVINSVALMREALVTKKDDFAGRSSISLYPLDIVLERGDIVSSDFCPALMFRRKVFKTALHIFGEGTSEAEMRVRDGVIELLDEIESTNGQAFSPKKYITETIVIVLWKWLVNKKCNYGDPTVHALLEFNHKMTGLVAQGSLHQLFPFLRHIPSEFHKTIDELEDIKKRVFEPELAEHRQSYEEGVTRDITDSFLFAYDKEKRKSNSKDTSNVDVVKCMMVDVILGGADTTSGFFNWFILYMILYPDLQKKIQQEMDEVVGRNHLPSLQDIPNLHWLQATVCELIRHSSFLPVAMPHSATRNTVLQGYEIRKDTVVFLNLYRINRDPTVWDDPTEFKPDRFIGADGRFVGWAAFPGYLPFGLGRRNCVGESLAKIQVFIVTSCLLHRFSFEVVKGEPKPKLEVGPPSSVRNPKNYKCIANRRT